MLSRRAEDRHPAMPWLGQPASHGMVGCSASDGATHARAYGPTHTHRHTHTWEHTHTHTQTHTHLGVEDDVEEEPGGRAAEEGPAAHTHK